MTRELVIQILKEEAFNGIARGSARHLVKVVEHPESLHVIWIFISQFFCFVFLSV